MTQASGACTYSVEPTVATLPAAGGNGSVLITTVSRARRLETHSRFVTKGPSQRHPTPAPTQGRLASQLLRLQPQIS